MKYSVQIFLALIFTIIPLYESTAAEQESSFGPTHLEIDPSLAYRLQYEDNIDRDASGKDRISDWSNQYRPGIRLSANSPNLSIFSEVELNIVEYINERDFNYVDQDYTFGLGYLLNERIEFSLGAGYRVYTNAFRFDEGGGGSGEDYTRYKDKTWNYSGGFSYVVSPRSTISLDGFLSDFETRNSDDTQLWGVAAGYTRNLSPRTNAILNTNYFYYDFKGSSRKFDPDDPVTVYSRLDQEMKNYSVTAGIEHNFANDSSFLISVGWRYTDQETSSTNAVPGNPKSSGNGDGWIVDIQWKRSWTEWEQAFEAHHDINVDPNGATFEQTTFISETIYNINQRLNLALRLEAKKEEGDSDEFVIDRDSRVYNVSPSVSYRLYRWLQTRAGWAFGYRDYKEIDRTVHYNVVFVELTFIPLRQLVVR